MIGEHVIIQKPGEHKGKRAVITWMEDTSMWIRVTPLNGDPLASLEFLYDEVERIPTMRPPKS